MTYSILRSCALALTGACLLLSAAAAEARPWGAAVGLERILAQARGQMSDAERERLRRDLSINPRDRGRESRRDTRMSPQQRESLRRDMRDANRQLDRKRGRNGGRNGGRGRDRERR